MNRLARTYTPEPVPPIVREVLRAPGRPLDQDARTFFESRFAQDFSGVRVHTDARAAESARAVDALAYTVGSDVVFGAGNYSPHAPAGRRLLSHELAHVVQQQASSSSHTLQTRLVVGSSHDPAEAEAERTADDIAAGGAASVQARPHGSPTLRRRLITAGAVGQSGDEKIEVADAAEEQEAHKIIQEIKQEYNIDLNSAKGVEGIRKQYFRVPATVLQQVKTRGWRLEELRALQRALKHYAPILGAARATSTRAGVAQEVETVGKLEQSVTANTPAGALEQPTGLLGNTAVGEYFEATKNASLLKASEGMALYFKGDTAKYTEAAWSHEIAHGLLAYRMPSFLSRFKYWQDEETPDPRMRGKVEAPITDYGTKNAREDLSETAKFFFVAPQTLLKGFGEPRGNFGNPCPERYRFMEETVAGWKSEAPPPEKTKDKK